MEESLASRGTVEIERWEARCKDCIREGTPTAEFTYPDSWRLGLSERGQSRSDRCPKHRQQHSRDARAFAAPFVDLATIAAIPDPEHPTGPLGALGPLPVEHRIEREVSDLSIVDFGLDDSHVLRLLDGMRDKQVGVVVAGTGSGKSTFLPYRLLRPPANAALNLADEGPIVITVPRRAAATSNARFVSEVLDKSKSVGAGAEIGYRIQGEPAYDGGTKLLYVTDGSLINWLRDGSFRKFSTIIVDEAHERSKNIDIILGLLRVILPNNPKLRLLVISATIDEGFFVEYFGGSEKVFLLDLKAETTKSWGYGEPLWPDREPDFTFWEHKRTDYPALAPDLAEWTALAAKCRVATDEIDVREWRAAMPELVAKQVVALLRGTPTGDILAFLPGLDAITQARAHVDAALEQLHDDGEATTQRPAVEVFSLLATTDKAEQARALGRGLPNGVRRVILSTNLAETSLTIDNLTFVVDSGLINQTKWDVITAQKSVPAVPHSQDGVRQRWGRVGRKAPGWVFPLYTKRQFEEVLPKHTPAGCTRDELEDFYLAAIAAGVDEPEKFVWPVTFQRAEDTAIERQTREDFIAELRRARRSLTTRSAVDTDGDISDLGRELQAFSGSMAVASALVLADKLSCAIEAATGLSLLLAGPLIGPRGLLLFDRKDDLGARDLARRKHEATLIGCKDDLDVALKVFAGWETAADPEQWAKDRLLNHKRLATAKTNRESLLEPLSPGKKSSTVRPLDLRLGMRLRAVLSRALPDLTHKFEAGQWKPLVPGDDRARRLVDAASTTPNGNRMIAFNRRASSRGDVYLSNLVEAYEWAQDGTLSLSAFCIEVQRRTRDAAGSLLGSTEDDYWFLSDWEIGAAYSVEPVDAALAPNRMRAVETIAVALPRISRALEALGTTPAKRTRVSGAETDTDDDEDAEEDEASDEEPGVNELDYDESGAAASPLTPGTDGVAPSEPEAELSADLQVDSSSAADLLLDADAVTAGLISLAEAGVVDPEQESERFSDPEDLEVQPEHAAGELNPDAQADSGSGVAAPMVPLPTHPTSLARLMDPAGRAIAAASGVLVLGFGEDAGLRSVVVLPLEPNSAAQDFDHWSPLRLISLGAITRWGGPYLSAVGAGTGYPAAIDSADLSLFKLETGTGRDVLQGMPMGTPFNAQAIGYCKGSRTILASCTDELSAALTSDRSAADDDRDWTRCDLVSRSEGQRNSVLVRTQRASGSQPGHLFAVTIKSILDVGGAPAQGMSLDLRLEGSNHVAWPKVGGKKKTKQKDMASLTQALRAVDLADVVDGRLIPRKPLSPLERDQLRLLNSAEWWLRAVDAAWRASNRFSVGGVRIGDSQNEQVPKIGESVEVVVGEQDSAGVLVSTVTGLRGHSSWYALRRIGLLDRSLVPALGSTAAAVVDGIDTDAAGDSVLDVLFTGLDLPPLVEQAAKLWPPGDAVVGIVSGTTYGIEVLLGEAHRGRVNQQELALSGLTPDSVAVGAPLRVAIQKHRLGPASHILYTDLLPATLATAVSVVESGADRAARLVPVGASFGGRVTGFTVRGDPLVEVRPGLRGLLPASAIGPAGCIAPALLLAMGTELPVTVAQPPQLGSRGELQVTLAAHGWAEMGTKDEQLRRVQEKLGLGITHTGRVTGFTARGDPLVEVKPGLRGLLPSAAIGQDGCIAAAVLLTPGTELPVTLAQPPQFGRRGELQVTLAARDWSDLGTTGEQLRRVQAILAPGTPHQGRITYFTGAGDPLVELRPGLQGILPANAIGANGCIAPPALIPVGTELPVTVAQLPEIGRRGELQVALAARDWSDLGTKDEQLRRVQELIAPGTQYTGRITGFTARGDPLVEVKPGLRGLLPSSAIGPDGCIAPTAFFGSGAVVEVTLSRPAQLNEGRLNINLSAAQWTELGTKQDQLRRVQAMVPTVVVNGLVTGDDKNLGAFVRIELATSGAGTYLSGLLYRQHLRPNTRLPVRVEGVRLSRDGSRVELALAIAT